MQNFGINCKIIEWIREFLCDRKQYVVVRGTKSCLCNISSGVPQGCALSPILFLVYINDLFIRLDTMYCM